jgi:geranylgeranyl diphosphate synthase type II
MNFKEYVENHRNEIYSTICNYLPIKEPEAHYRMVRDYPDRQGSYRRPGLLMLAGQVFGANIDNLILPAAAMQLSEDWILMHDDIEDRSEMRRGKPAIQNLYGFALGINAGDAVHMVMWRMLRDYISKAGIPKGGAVYDKFYDILEKTVEGQYMDCNFIFNIKKISGASEKMYFDVINKKTGYYTVYGPMQLGAIIAGADQATLDNLEAIGKPAGMAFQIVDDILDMTADEKVFGKKRYGDLYEGKITLIVLHAYSEATEAEKKRIDEIYVKDRPDKTEDEINYIIDIINKYSGLDYAREVADRYGKQTKEAVEKYSKEFPENEYTKIILTAMEELYLRKK